MPLTDTQIKGLKPAGKLKKHSVGGGLHLLVSPQGSKLWRQAYRFDGKQNALALGSYRVVSLADGTMTACRKHGRRCNSWRYCIPGRAS